MSIPGSNIRILRQRLNISLADLAGSLGMDKGGLSKLERGEQGYSREAIEKIAKILGVSIGVLFAEPEAVEAAALRMRRFPLLAPEELLHWRGPDTGEVPEDGEFLYGSITRMSRYAFALRVPADHPWPGFAPGSDLVFDAKGKPARGQIVVAHDNHGAIYVGRLRTVEGNSHCEIWPIGALDPSASSEKIPDLTIRGVLVEERKYSF